MHHGGHPIQILAELLLLALGKVVMVCVLVFIASCFVALGLAIGGVIFSLFGRKRHLFWALPLANFLVYLSLHRVLNNRMSTDKISFLDQFYFPLVESTILAFLVLTLLGWVSAILLTPLQWLLRSVKSSQEQTTTDENQVLHEYLARPRPVSTWSAFQEGFWAPLFGFGYLCRYPRLWRYAIIPIALNLLITGLTLILFLMVVAGFLTYLHPAFPPGWGWILLEIVCGILLLLLAFGAAFATWIVLQAILCGHYYEKLARQVELQLGMRSEDLAGLSLREQTVDTLLDLFLLVSVYIGFLFLHLIPVLGSVVSVLGSLCFSCYLLGAAYLGFPLGLRQWHRKQRADFTRHFRFQTAGLGTAVFFVAFLPMISSLVLTTAVVGAVLLHRRLEASEADEQGGQTLSLRMSAGNG